MIDEIAKENGFLTDFKEEFEFNDVEYELKFE